MTNLAPPPPGFFGKVPARGDFLARRVPPALDPAWETWLASLVVAAREALAARWPEDWLTAPLWHFSLGSALAAPRGAAGVLVASADRVGRLFPFTIIGACAPNPDGADLDAQALDLWARAAENLCLAALDDDFTPDRLDAALVALGPPPATSAGPQTNGSWPLALEANWPAPAADRLDSAARLPPGPDQSAWWCRGSDLMPPMHLRCTGLPPAELAAAMITGRFPPE